MPYRRTSASLFTHVLQQGIVVELTQSDAHWKARSGISPDPAVLVCPAQPPAAGISDVESSDSGEILMLGAGLHDGCVAAELVAPTSRSSRRFTASSLSSASVLLAAGSARSTQKDAGGIVLPCFFDGGRFTHENSLAPHSCAGLACGKWLHVAAPSHLKEPLSSHGELRFGIALRLRLRESESWKQERHTDRSSALRLRLATPIDDFLNPLVFFLKMKYCRGFKTRWHNARTRHLLCRHALMVNARADAPNNVTQKLFRSTVEVESIGKPFVYELRKTVYQMFCFATTAQSRP